MTLSEWISVGDSTLPQQQIATTDDRDQGVTVTQELKLDFDSFNDPVDNSIFYLDHYGLPEPKIESPYRRYLIYGFFWNHCNCLNCLVSFTPQTSLRHMRSLPFLNRKKLIRIHFDWSCLL